MNRIRHLTRAAVPAVTTALAVLALAAPAHADPGSEGLADGDDGYAKSIALSWDGEQYTTAVAQSFLGDPVVVPGDHTTATLFVRNDGPTAGTLRASIVNVELLDPDAPDQGNFYDDLTLTWDEGSASFTELDARGQTQILQVELDEGEQVPITLSYGLGVRATSGNQANVHPRMSSFDVLLEIGGELPAQVPADPPTQIPVEETSGQAAAGSSAPGAPGLQATGAGGLTALLITGAIMLGGGLALRRIASRGAPARGRRPMRQLG